jgi:hypothetical protein
MAGESLKESSHCLQTNATPTGRRQCSAAVWRQDFADLNRTMDNELYAPFFCEMSHLQYRLMRAFGAYHVGF